MKKTLLNFVLILGGLFFILTFLDRKGEYAVEQRLWKANQKLVKISKDPNVVPDKTFEETARDYERLVKAFPESKLRSRAQMLLAQVYLVRKDYVTSRKKLEEIFVMYPNQNELHAEVYLAMAKSYEHEDDWPKAEAAYQKLIKQYALTDIGINAPLYLANYYRQKKELIKSNESFAAAIVHYQKIAKEHPDSELEYKALRNLANCYLLQKRWREGLDIFGDILLKYPTPRLANQIIKTINAVSVIELKDFSVPIEIYQEVLTKEPNHPIAKTLKKMVDGFTELKNKNVQINTQEAK